MKKLSLILAVVLIISLFAGCAGTPVVYYTNCTCPVDSHTAPQTPVVAKGALKTGRYISANISDSKDAAADADGEAKYDITIVGVLVDESGVIIDCKVDSIGTSEDRSKADR